MNQRVFEKVWTSFDRMLRTLCCGSEGRSFKFMFDHQATGKLLSTSSKMVIFSNQRRISEQKERACFAEHDTVGLLDPPSLEPVGFEKP